MINEPIAFEQTAMKLSVTWAGQGHAFIVASVRSPADAGQTAGEAYDRTAEMLRDHGLQVIHERIFGSLSVEPSVMAARQRALQTYGVAPDNPLTYIQGAPPWGEGFNGMIIHAVAAEKVWTIRDGNIPCGRGWRKNGLTYLVLQNIQAFGNDSAANIDEGARKTTQISFPQATRAGNPSGNEERFRIPKHRARASRNDKKTSGCSVTNEYLSMSKPIQTRQMLDRAERILRENDASYRDVVRTWFYLSDILDWYAAFNKVRNEKYGEFGIMPGPGDNDLLLPASTGINGDMPSGASSAMDLLAVVDDDTNKNISRVSFPLVGNPSGERLRTDPGQCRDTSRSDKGNSDSRVKQLTNAAQLDAFRYGSAFSRGAVIQEPDVALIEISGTAAIDEHGVSLYPGDIRSQITCTFDKIEKLISKEGAGLKDIAAATVFVKSPEHASTFWEMAKDRGLEEFPAVCIVADVCRDELLFEIDGEGAVRK